MVLPPSRSSRDTAVFYSCIGNCRIPDIDICAQLLSEMNRYPQGPIVIDFDVVSTVLRSGCSIKAPYAGWWLQRTHRVKKNSSGGSGIKIDTYRAPRTVTAIAPKLVTKTPHRSMAGATQVEATATSIFLTPLEYDEQNVKSVERKGAYE